LFGSRRQWTTDETADHAQGFNRTGPGIRYRDQAGFREVYEPSEELQGRFGRPGTQAGDRGGWALTSNAEVEIPGSPQDGDTECAREVSIEVLERGSPREPRTGGPEDQFVYDLGI